MSYTAIDQSAQGGDVVCLIKYTYGSTIVRHTTDGADYVADDGTYLAVQGGIDCSDIESTEEKVRNNPTLKVSREYPIAELFRVASPSYVVGVTIREVHRGDTDYVVRFKGRVTTSKWNGALAELSLISLEESGGADGLKMKCQRHCEANLFGDGCGLNPDDWDHSATVSTIDGLTIVVSSVDGALNYAGGELKWVSGGVTDSRMIETQSGTTLTLIRVPYGLAVSDTVTLYPGCDHTYTTCDTVFSNRLNYRGRPHLSTKNPMAGQSLF